MKKLLSFAIFLCVLCLSFAYADSSAITSDGSPLEFDDFVLTPEAGMIYTLGEKSPGKMIVTVYPYAASGDTSTNLNFVWNGAPFAESVSFVESHKEQIKAGVIQVCDTYGYTLNSLDYGDCLESNFGGKYCVYFDGVTNISVGTNTLNICQRGIFIGSIGYEVSVTAADPETVEQAAQQLEAMLAWK